MPPTISPSAFVRAAFKSDIEHWGGVLNQVDDVTLKAEFASAERSRTALAMFNSEIHLQRAGANGWRILTPAEQLGGEAWDAVVKLKVGKPGYTESKATVEWLSEKSLPSMMAEHPSFAGIAQVESGLAKHFRMFTADASEARRLQPLIDQVYRRNTGQLGGATLTTVKVDVRGAGDLAGLGASAPGPAAELGRILAFGA